MKKVHFHTEASSKPNSNQIEGLAREKNTFISGLWYFKIIDYFLVRKKKCFFL